MTPESLERARQLWAAHVAAPFPDEFDKNEEYEGVDAVLVDADAAGIISTILGGGRLDDPQRTELQSVEVDVLRLIEAVPLAAKQYFERLLTVVRELLR